MATAISWPEKFLPGTTDNFVSNETIVKDLTAEQVWPLLADVTKWETYYDNCSDITPPSSGKWLEKGDKFSFSTFGFPPLSCEIYESEKPSKGKAGRLAWGARLDGDDPFEAYHAWIIEDLEYGPVRILTQETQIGKPAAEIAKSKPNKMLNGHDEWLTGLVEASRKAKA